jgi:hypothetical protein
MAPRAPKSVALAAFSEALFGPVWAANVARLTGAHVRTVQRIREAAREGREHPRAADVAERLAEAVATLMASAEAMAPVQPTRKRHRRAKVAPIAGPDGSRETRPAPPAT